MAYTERELIPMAKALNVGVTAWSPLANGVLTGRLNSGPRTICMQKEMPRTFAYGGLRDQILA
jgi:aryl-alcohol dehydrogenase-like predicted oxidoreductase